MDDRQIVALYWQRSESAIAETAAKYGRYCFTIANNILQSKEDADESVSDTYLAAWNRIPPHRPSVLSAFLGKLTRRISLNRWRSRNTQKRGGGQVFLALEELSECVPGGTDTAEIVEQKELTAAVNRFLSGLKAQERDVFLCRYWFFASIREISQRTGFSDAKIKSILHRTRNKLKAYLQEEGLI